MEPLASKITNSRILKTGRNDFKTFCSTCKNLMTTVRFICTKCNKYIECNECHNISLGGEQFCNGCNRLLKCLKEEIKNEELHNILVECKYKAQGCVNVERFPQLSTHEKSCCYQPFKCPAKCNRADLILKNKTEHLEKCEYVEVECEECQRAIQKRLMPSHQKDDCIIHFSHCYYCEQNVRNPDKKIHYESCLLKLAKCNKCNGKREYQHNCEKSFKNSIQKNIKTIQKAIRTNLSMQESIHEKIDDNDLRIQNQLKENLKEEYLTLQQLREQISNGFSDTLSNQGAQINDNKILKDEIANQAKSLDTNVKIIKEAIFMQGNEYETKLSQGISEICNQNQKVINELSNINSKIESKINAEIKIDHLLDTLNKLLDEMRKEQSKVNKFHEANIETLVKESKIFKDTMQEMENENEIIEKEKARVQKEAENFRHELAMKDELINKKENEINDLRMKCDSERISKEEKEKELNNIKSECKIIEDKNCKIQEQNSELTKGIEEKNITMKVLEEENKNLKINLEKKIDEAKEKDKEIESIKKRNELLEKEYTGLQKELVKQGSIIETQSKEIEQNNKKIKEGKENEDKEQKKRKEFREKLWKIFPAKGYDDLKDIKEEQIEELILKQMDQLLVSKEYNEKFNMKCLECNSNSDYFHIINCLKKGNKIVKNNNEFRFPAFWSLYNQNLKKQEILSLLKLAGLNSTIQFINFGKKNK